MNKEPGYVYILTNPSFREDWVKIGKSSRPVDVRSKELDNTAVPLPFEIYATMRTAKYNEAERLVHRYIERFTNLRILTIASSSTSSPKRLLRFSETWHLCSKMLSLTRCTFTNLLIVTPKHQKLQKARLRIVRSLGPGSFPAI